MRMFALIILMIAIPGFALAQGTRVERLIESSLSGPGRIVDVTGFRGALSTRASFETMTIADDTGVWLTISGAVLDWNLSALLNGTLEVAELSATQIDVARPPLPPELDLPAAQASEFKLPELPVAVRIDKLSVPRITLGETVLGEAMMLDLITQARLDSSGADIALTANRIDGDAGAFRVNATYVPETSALTILTTLSEDPGGFVGRALNLPGSPQLDLSVEGSGPLDAFVAEIALKTDNQERLAGDITLRATSGGDRRFEADIGGDIRPLLSDDARDFFGASTRIQTQGTRSKDGALALDTLTLKTAQLDLVGQAAIASDGRPELIALSGTMTSAKEIALPGSDLVLQNADLDIAFDANRGPDWTLDVVANGLESPEFEIATARFSGSGLLTPGAATVFSGAIALTADGMAFSDTSVARAVGSSLRLDGDLRAQESGRVTLTDLTAKTSTAQVSGSIDATPIDRQMALGINLRLDAPDLTPFSGIAAPIEGGAIGAQLTVDTVLPGGVLTIDLQGQSQRLDIGNPRLKPLLEPQSTLSLRLRRDLEGTVLEAFEISNPLLTAQGGGAVSTNAASLDLNAALSDIALLEPTLAGPVRFVLNAKGDPEIRAFNGTFGLRSDFADLTGRAQSQQTPEGDTIDFDSNVDAEDLRLLANLIAPVRAGRLSGRVIGVANVDTGAVTATLTAQSNGLDIGQRQVLPLLQPTTDLTVELQRTDTGLRVPVITLDNPLLSANGSAQLDDTGFDAKIEAELSKVEVLEPRIGGPVSLTISADGSSDFSALKTQYALATRFAALDGTGALTTTDGVREFASTATLSAQSLAPLSRIAAPLRGGRLQSDLALTLGLDTSELSFVIDGETRGLDIGVAQLAPFLTPQTRFRAEVSGSENGIVVDGIEIRNSAITADGSVDLVQNSGSGEVRAQIRDLGVLVPALPGSVTLTATAQRLLDGPQIDAQIRGANGILANVLGRVGLPNGRVDIAARGTAPLALAQPFLQGRILTGDAGFDLTMAGQPSLAAVSGTIGLQNARLSDPELGLTISPINGRIQLANARAEIALDARANGGTLQANGATTLIAPYPTDLAITLGNVSYRFADVFKTTLSGALRVRGAAIQQIAIGGDVTLTETEIQVPDTGLGTIDPVPVIKHFGASAAARQTLARADLPDPTSSDGTGSSGPRIPLDINIVAGDPIFVRGRGLDAEFQGQLRVSGTVATPVPVGQFTLRRGRLSFLGQRLTLTEGAITAAGSLIPRLRIVAEASTPDVTARITLDGPADQPELSLSSVPDLPEDEILALLLFGQSAANLSPFQVARLISSLSQLSGRSSGGFLSDTRTRLGFDDLDLRTDADTGQIELAIGKYIDENVYSEIELGAQGNAQINLNLDLSDSTRLRGSLNSNGETGIGVFWQRDY